MSPLKRRDLLFRAAGAATGFCGIAFVCDLAALLCQPFWRVAGLDRRLVAAGQNA